MECPAAEPPGSLKDAAADVPLGVIGAASFHRAQAMTSYDRCSKAHRHQLGEERFHDSMLTRTALERAMKSLEDYAALQRDRQGI